MHDLQKAGKYQILERIGEGGFGVVYKGRDPFIKRSVAIKTCTSSSEETRRRFLREAEIAGNIEHPNITVVYDFGFQDEVPYLVQEFLSGEDLDHVIERRDRLSLDAKLTCLLQAASGLGFAHEQGITHRDIKPANLRILEDGRVKIMDFGIAKVAGVDTQLTQTGTTLGTPAYLSPEQLRGDAVDQRSDIYSFGVLAFELLTYRRLFDADTISSLFYQILHQTPQRLRSLWPEAPQVVDDLIADCVAKSPDDRPQTFEPIVSRLEAAIALLEGQPDKFYPAQEGPVENTGADPEQLRQEAMTAARNHIENLLASGQLEAARRALDEAQGSFGDQVPFRTLHDRLLSLRRSTEISPDAVTAQPTVVDLPEADEAPTEVTPPPPPPAQPPAEPKPPEPEPRAVDAVLDATHQLIDESLLTLAEEKLDHAREEYGERPELLAVSRQIKLRRRLEEGRQAIEAGDLLAAGRLLEHASDIDPESTELLHLRSELHDAVARVVDESEAEDGAETGSEQEETATEAELSTSADSEIETLVELPTEEPPGAEDEATHEAAAEPAVAREALPTARETTGDLSEAPTVLTTWDELEKQREAAELEASPATESVTESGAFDAEDALTTNPLTVPPPQAGPEVAPPLAAFGSAALGGTESPTAETPVPPVSEPDGPPPAPDLPADVSDSGDSGDESPATAMLEPAIADAARAPRSEPVEPLADSLPEPTPEPLPSPPLEDLSDVYLPQEPQRRLPVPWIAAGVIGLLVVILLLRALGGGDDEEPAAGGITSVSVLLDANPWATLQEIRTPGGDGEPIEIGPVVQTTTAAGDGEEAQRSTPLRLQLAPGDYEFVLTHAQAEEPLVIAVTVPARESFRFVADLPGDDRPAAERYLERLGLGDGGAR